MSEKSERDTKQEGNVQQDKEVQFIEPFRRPKAGNHSENTTGRAVEITPQGHPESLKTTSTSGRKSSMKEERQKELNRDKAGRPVFGVGDIPEDPAEPKTWVKEPILDDLEAAEAKKKPQMLAAAAVAIVAVIAILCTMIWQISHREDRGSLLADNNQTTDQAGQNTLAATSDKSSSTVSVAQNSTDSEADSSAAKDESSLTADSGAIESRSNSTVGSGAAGSGSKSTVDSGAAGSGSNSTVDSGVAGSGSETTVDSSVAGRGTSSTVDSSTAGSDENTATGASKVANSSTAPGASTAEIDGNEVAVSGQASASWDSGSGTDQAGMNHTGESGEVAQIAMTFEATNDTVTAKEKTNLRSLPSTAEEDLIVKQIKNGEQIKRTGINYDTGWSKLEVDGQTLYAVSRYLTTDLQPEVTQVAANNSPKVKLDTNQVLTKDGRIIQFTDCDDTVSAKIKCNLRGEPSTSQGNASIHKELFYGDTAHRTGISEDSGWSRVEYNGEVLYAVSSYIYTVDDSAAE
jgi:hypothetical protein